MPDGSRRPLTRGGFFSPSLEGGRPPLLLFNPRRALQFGKSSRQRHDLSTKQHVLGPQCLDDRLAAHRGSDAVSRGCVVGSAIDTLDLLSRDLSMTFRNRMPVLLPTIELRARPAAAPCCGAFRPRGRRPRRDPSETLLAALGSCLSARIHANAASGNIAVHSLELTIEADVVTSPMWAPLGQEPRPVGFEAIRVEYVCKLQHHPRRCARS